ncbi:MAG TPA: SAM-dependent methyltransferase [Novimethylophilus sp.]|jgi:SAM-dependent MidA family methyltransferase|uniref:class I SAM-dependent methyltransferase n=1 Tax=Novimethylophilus sp. TaxID=2137426 RepID=UPI002F42AF2E
MSALPQPSPDALAHSAALDAVIRSEIEAAGGWLPFDRYMELALYAPGLGYYSAGLEKFGVAGDFVTAPEISGLFGRCLARQARQVLEVTGGDVLELGAGSGKLAVDMLAELDRQGCLPERYLILEVSAYLRDTQKKRINSSLSGHVAQKVVWLDAMPDSFSGLVVGNEVLDALPISLVAWQESGLCERGVAVRDGRFTWQDRPLTAGPLFGVARELALPPGHVSEVGLAAGGLIASLSRMLERGVVLMLDYGFPRREYYHPQRAQGTLMCHYRHQAHDDPLLYPGLQDITAHVDFTAAAEAAVANGTALLGYASQTQFLINCGITDFLAEVSPRDAAAYLPLAAQAQKLLSPAEMGELFKAIAFGKEYNHALLGFVRGDKRHTL